MAQGSGPAGLNWLLVALVVARYGASRLTRQTTLLETESMVIHRPARLARDR